MVYLTWASAHINISNTEEEEEEEEEEQQQQQQQKHQQQQQQHQKTIGRLVVLTVPGPERL